MCLKGSNGFSQTLLRMLGHPLSTTRKYPNVLNANGWELFNSLADRKFEGNFIPFGHFLGQPIQARTILPPSLPPSNGFPSAILLVFFFFLWKEQVRLRGKCCENQIWLGKITAKTWLYLTDYVLDWKKWSICVEEGCSVHCQSKVFEWGAISFWFYALALHFDLHLYFFYDSNIFFLAIILMLHRINENYQF